MNPCRVLLCLSKKVLFIDPMGFHDIMNFGARE
jgi:hypothetical protein